MEAINTHTSVSAKCCNPSSSSPSSLPGIEVRVRNLGVNFAVQKALITTITERLQGLFKPLYPIIVTPNSTDFDLQGEKSASDIYSSGHGRPLLQDINFHVSPGQGKKRIGECSLLFALSKKYHCDNRYCNHP